jgi:hypothetical protein
MTTRAKNSDFESDQEQPITNITATMGNKRPGHTEVIKGANARSKVRHETSGDQYADVNVLPKSGGGTLDKDGINDNGYLVKKGTPYGVDVFFNSLPPGSDITDQEVADIRVEEMKTWMGGLSFPGDGGF